MHAPCRNATALIVGFLVLSVLAGCSNATPAPPPTGSTIKEIDINPGTGSSNPKGFTLYKGSVYFSAIPAANGAQLMKYDGTNPPSAISSTTSFNPSYLTVFNSTLYMAAGSGIKLYSSIGTSPVEVTTSPTLSTVQYLQVYGNDLFMSASGGSYTQGVLWALSNQSAPVSVTGSGPTHLVVMGSTLYYSASDLTNGRQLWSYDGSSALMITTQGAGADAVFQTPTIVVFNNVLYFPASTDTGTTFHLYSYTGSGNATAVSGSPLVGVFSDMAVCNGALFLRSTDGALQKFDGANFTNLTGGSPTLDIRVTFGVLNNALYFAGTTDGTRFDLYKYDTAVSLVKTFSATAAQAPGQFAAINGKLYFQANDTTASTQAGNELWVLD